jgi:hypothetical protein
LLGAERMRSHCVFAVAMGPALRAEACLETRGIAAHKLELIEQKIAGLSKMRKSLARLVRSCDASSAGAPCPIIHLLADG